MTDPRLLLLLLALPFVGSILAGLLPTRGRNKAAALAGTISVGGALITASAFGPLSNGISLRYELAWLPSLDLDLVLRLDGLSWLFAMMVTGVGSLVVLYARYYMAPTDPVPRFFSFLLAFMGSMLGVVLSGNIIQIAFFWELTSIFSFLLIGYWHHNPGARDGARMSLIVTATGGVCLLIGFLLLGHIAGGYDLEDVLGAGAAIHTHPLYAPMLILILVGAFTKSAQFPFHFWLPQAMAAPTPVSAYLHSATLVKAGVFVMILLWPVLSGTELWFFLVAGAGLLTLLIGAWSAIFQQDLKGMLAYSTISHLGLITLLLGMGSTVGLVAAIFHTVNHATFKASLFMAAGIIDHETGTRDIRRLSGLSTAMPITATLAMVAAAAMAGVPLLNGFISKEMFLAASLQAHSGTIIDTALPWLATVASMFSVLYSLRFIHQTFFGPPATDLPKQPHEAPRWMLLPMEILVLACLLVGIVPALTIGPALALAAHAVLGDATPDYSLAIWHGFNLPLVMSLAALVGGAALYLWFGDRLNRLERSPVIGRVRGRRAFEAVLTMIIEGAVWLRDRLGTRRLQVQLRLLIITAILAGALPLLILGLHPGDVPLTQLDPVFVPVWLVGAACAATAAFQAKYHRLVSLILLGGAGLAVCITFIWLSAPDLALTQMLVEIVTLFLLLLSLRWLPQRKPDDWPDEQTPWYVRLRRAGDLAIALTAGAGMAFVSYAMMTRPPTDSIAEFFVRNAYSGGGGTNVVNVILVDFRSFDTLGEVTVLAIVALTVFTLLRRFRPARESIQIPQQQRRQNAYDEADDDREHGDTVKHYLFIPRIIMEWLFPVILAFAFYLLLRGHDLPGGGFAGGVAASIALIILYMAHGTRWVEARIHVQPLRWVGLGLLLACATGVAAWLFGQPFLTTAHRYVSVPLIGDVPAASALIFDIGIFAVVVGSTVLTLIALAHQSIRAPRLREPEQQDRTMATVEGGG